MITSTVEYLGGLRTKCTHLASGTEILTDAPLDNKGKGESFSPTDLVATSFASCVITIMGIFCANNDILFEKAQAEVEKIMTTDPRRIGKLIVALDLRGNGWDELTAKKVIRAGKACPVAHTLGDNVSVEYTIHY
jgi:putative redox protein